MIKKIIVFFFVLGLLFPVVSTAKISQSVSDEFENSRTWYGILDIPDWATHEFRGVMGITDAMGHPLKPQRFVGGYCTDSFKGKFLGVIIERNQTEPHAFLGGSVMGPFLFGLTGVLDNDERIPLVGIGGSNETHFYFRLMSIRGPTFYIAGMYEPLV
ncbi:MAG: hypothetical protein KAR20_00365 [Candidatus Heimdallarchaeota archaeon]|nr:hypothetical protein [Candidatus Heimdallarchaeota archaeon]